jgi:streptomycin 6-kinase
LSTDADDDGHSRPAPSSLLLSMGSLDARLGVYENGRVSGFELPRDLLRDVEEHDDDGSARRAWVASLPRVVDELAQRWSLELGRPFQPGGSASWVAPARDTAGEHLVLKVGWWHDEAIHEADGLRAWDGGGAVRLVDAVVVGLTSALLLEACEPGTALSEVLPPEQQDSVVAGLLRRLWITPSADHPFRTLQRMCDIWADEFEAKYASARAQRKLDPGLARAGIELFRCLPGTSGRAVLLCTDLHAENVLAARREPWLVIDPKPYLGDPTYDPLQHMLNHPDRLLADPAGFAQRMADLLDLDAERLRQWLFARCVQESLDEPDLHIVATDLAPA